MALVRNAVWNLGGQLVPLAAAVAVVPILLQVMGTEGFGLVAIIWTLIGYFSLFDFGLGRALTKFVSAELGRRPETLPDIIVTGMALLAAAGLVMASIIWMLVPWLVGSVLKPKISDPAEIVVAFRIAALTIPLVVTNVGLRAILEGFMRFDLTNRIRIPFGLYTIIVPAVVAYSGFGLIEIVVAIACGVLAAMLGYALLLKGAASVVRNRGGAVRWSLSRRLVGFGGWISVSNFVAPLIFHLDRFVISAALTVAAMSYYVVPYEAITKTLVISSAIAGSMFPVFARAPDRDGASHMSTMVTGTRAVIALMFPILLTVVCFRFELLNLWVGRDVAINGSGPLLLLSIGVFFNAIAYMPYTLAQANGRADWVAKVQLVQLPIYPVILWLSVLQWGLEGAAGVWMARAFFEMAAFLLLAGKIAQSDSVLNSIALYGMFGAAILSIGLVLEEVPLLPRVFALIAIVSLISWLLWWRLFSAGERSWIFQRWQRIASQLLKGRHYKNDIER